MDVSPATMGLSVHLPLTIIGRSLGHQRHGYEESCPRQGSFVTMAWIQCTLSTDSDVAKVQRRDLARGTTDERSTYCQHPQSTYCGERGGSS